MKKDENVSEVCIILDESGSMTDVEKDTIGGFNKFLEDQKKIKGKVNLSLYKFNTKYENVYFCEDIQNIKKLSEDNYVPGSMTALLDAVGRGINDISIDISQRKDNNKPNKLLFVIITDGAENSSKEYEFSKIKNLIKEKEKDNWEFLFLGANLENFSDAGNMGVNMTANMSKSDFETSMKSMSIYTASFRKDSKSAEERLNYFNSSSDELNDEMKKYQEDE